MSNNKSNLSKTLWNILKYLIAAYLIYYIFSLTDLPSLLNVLKNISLIHLLVVIFFIIIEIFFISYRFWVLLGKAVPIPKIINLVIFQKSMAAVIATIAGFAAFVTGLKTDYDIKVSQGVTTFLIAKLGDLFAIIVFMSVSSLFVWDSIEVLRYTVILIVTAILVGFFVLVLGIKFREKLLNIIEKFYNKFSLNRFNVLLKLKDYLHFLFSLDVAKNLIAIQVGLITSLLILGSTAGMAYFLTLAFNISISPWAIIFMLSLQRLMSLIPIYVFGGLGVVDVTSVFLYGLFGFSLAEIAPTIIGFRLIKYLLMIFVFGLIPLNKLLFDRKTNESEEGLGVNNE